MQTLTKALQQRSRACLRVPIVLRLVSIGRVAISIQRELLLDDVVRCDGQRITTSVRPFNEAASAASLAFVRAEPHGHDLQTSEVEPRGLDRFISFRILEIANAP